MYSLLIDTHSSFINIVLYKDKKLLNLLSRQVPSQSKLLVCFIKEILENQNLNICNIKEVIVVNGPGSFTGVRLGVTVAKTISYCLNIPIKSVSSLDLLAISTMVTNNFSVAIQDPKGYYIAEYNDEKKLLGDYFYLNNSDFVEYSQNNIVIKDEKINWDDIYKFNLLKEENYFNIRPLYIKKIEVEK